MAAAVLLLATTESGGRRRRREMMPLPPSASSEQPPASRQVAGASPAAAPSVGAGRKRSRHVSPSRLPVGPQQHRTAVPSQWIRTCMQFKRSWTTRSSCPAAGAFDYVDRN